MTHERLWTNRTPGGPRPGRDFGFVCSFSAGAGETAGGGFGGPGNGFYPSLQCTAGASQPGAYFQGRGKDYPCVSQPGPGDAPQLADSPFGS